MSFELGENQLSTLGLIVGFNKSDSTYGWNGYLGGMKRFKINIIYLDLLPFKAFLVKAIQSNTVHVI